MITSVRSAGIFVADQDRAKAFWTETVGFELVQDTPMGEGAGAPRWLEVKSPDGTILVLFTPEGQEDRIGTFSNVLFQCDDVQGTYRELARKGIGDFYRGAIGADIVQTVQHPPLASKPIGTWAYPIRPGVLTRRDQDAPM